MRLTRDQAVEYLEGAKQRHDSSGHVRQFSPEFFEALDDYVLEYGPLTMDVKDTEDKDET